MSRSTPASPSLEQPSVQVGAITCTVLSDGGAAYPKELLFQDVDEDVLRRELGSRLAADGTVESVYHCVLLQTPTARILVDSGLGRLAQVEGLPAGHLVSSLSRVGYRPDDIDVVVLTHAHPDHIGGLVTDGRVTFRNARHVLSLPEWDLWTDEDALSRMPEPFAAPARAIFPVLHRADCIDPVDMRPSGRGSVPEAEISQGVLLRLAPGHTPGHCVVTVTSQGRSLTLLADTLVDPLQFRHLDWTCAFDHTAEDTVRTRRALLAEAAESESDLLAYHVGTFGQVTADDEGFSWHRSPEASAGPGRPVGGG